MAKTKRNKKQDPEEYKQFLLKQGHIFSQELISNATQWEKILMKVLDKLDYEYQFQVPVIVPIHKSYKLYVLDFLLPEYQLVIECNSIQYHTTKDQIKKDNLRARRLAKQGYSILILFNKQIQDLSYKEIDTIIQKRIQMIKSVNKLDMSK